MHSFVPEPVIKRLPAYYRHFAALEQEGAVCVSSIELSQRMNLTPSQIRHDTNCFGAKGRQGSGYPVIETRRHLETLLGINRQQTMVVIGAGNLGSALVCYNQLMHSSFTVTAVFDADPQKNGKQIGDLKVQPMEQLEAFVNAQKADVAALLIPADTAQHTAQRLYRCGIRSFWNFAPVDLQLPADAVSVNVHLDDSLQLLSYRLLNRNP